MTNNETRQVLQNVNALSNSMDKKHLKKLFFALTNAHGKKTRCVFLFYRHKKRS